MKKLIGFSLRLTMVLALVVGFSIPTALVSAAPLPQNLTVVRNGDVNYFDPAAPASMETDVSPFGNSIHITTPSGTNYFQETSWQTSALSTAQAVVYWSKATFEHFPVIGVYGADALSASDYFVYDINSITKFRLVSTLTNREVELTATGRIPANFEGFVIVPTTSFKKLWGSAVTFSSLATSTSGSLFVFIYDWNAGNDGWYIANFGVSLDEIGFTTDISAFISSATVTSATGHPIFNTTEPFISNSSAFGYPAGQINYSFTGGMHTFNWYVLGEEYMWGTTSSGTVSAPVSIAGKEGIVTYIENNSSAYIDVPFMLRDFDNWYWEYFNYDEQSPRYLFTEAKELIQSNTSGKIPPNFKGYVAVPLSSFKFTRTHAGATPQGMTLSNIELLYVALDDISAASLAGTSVLMKDIQFFISAVTPAVFFSGYNKKAGNILTNIAIGTTGTTLLSPSNVQKDANTTLTLKDANDAPKLESSLIGTGTKVDVTINSTYSHSFTAVIYGDLQGDGAVNLSDLAKLKLCLLKADTLSASQQMAAKMNNSQTITISNLLMLKKAILGLTTINQGA